MTIAAIGLSIGVSFLLGSLTGAAYSEGENAAGIALVIVALIATVCLGGVLFAP